MRAVPEGVALLVAVVLLVADSLDDPVRPQPVHQINQHPAVREDLNVFQSRAGKPYHMHPLLCRKQVLFDCRIGNIPGHIVMHDRNVHPVKARRRATDDILVPARDRVKTAGDQCAPHDSSPPVPVADAAVTSVMYALPYFASRRSEK